jgi:hypothetical protein
MTISSFDSGQAWQEPTASQSLIWARLGRLMVQYTSREEVMTQVPWNYKHVELNAWFRCKKDKAHIKGRAANRITSYGPTHVAMAYDDRMGIVSFSYTRLAADWEWTLDDPRSENAVWHPCTRMIADSPPPSTNAVVSVAEDE